MTVRLPPHVVFVPMHAVFRDSPLPPELWQTWTIVLGIAWSNKYRFTPPVSIGELLTLHHQTVQERALIERLRRLEELGWLTIQRESGTSNVYYPVVPPDVPVVVPRSAGALNRIRDALSDLGLKEKAVLNEVLALAHVSPEFLEDWVPYRRENPQLGPGFYRTQIRLGHVSPYTMSESERAAYRHSKT